MYRRQWQSSGQDNYCNNDPTYIIICRTDCGRYRHDNILHTRNNKITFCARSRNYYSAIPVHTWAIQRVHVLHQQYCIVGLKHFWRVKYKCITDIYMSSFNRYYNIYIRLPGTYLYIINKYFTCFWYPGTYHIFNSYCSLDFSFCS